MRIMHLSGLFILQALKLSAKNQAAFFASLYWLHVVTGFLKNITKGVILKFK